MKVSRIELQKPISNKISKRITKPFNSNKTIKQLPSIGIAAMSGMYIARMAENKKDMLPSNIKVNDSVAEKILTTKNDKGELVFDDKTLDILSKIASFKDKTFYDLVMKNLEGIQSLKEDAIFDPNTFTLENVYVMSAKTKNGELDALVRPSCYYMTEIAERNGDKKQITKIINNDNVSDYRKENYKYNMLLDYVDVFYDKRKNTITRTEADRIAKKVVSYETVFSQKNILTDQAVTKYITDKEDNVTSKTVNKDYKHQAISHSEAESYFEEMTTQTKTYLNPKTGKEEKHIKKISDVNGVFNSVIIDSLGNKKIESIGKVDKFGNQIVKKELESFDGTKTNYYYKSSKDNNDIQLSYNITDKDGNKLMTMDRTFKRVSPNLAYSSINGHRYEMKKEGDFIEVKDYFNDKTTKINVNDMLLYGYDPINYKIFDKLSGDMLLDFYNRNYKFVLKDNINDFYTSPKQNFLQSSNDVFIFSHEHGHAKDYAVDDEMGYINKIANNEEFKKIYNKERTMFIENMSHIDKSAIDYFINNIDHNLGKIGGNIETVAEINAILSTSVGSNYNILASRLYYLQKYFPQTIAFVSRFVTPDANLIVKS